jgi:predicted ATPase/DNA-binding SARP family transcriptional activator
MVKLKLFLLGPPRLELDGAPIKLERRKAAALLAYLLVNQQSYSRNSLAAMFWPDYDQRRARAALRRTLATLKQAGLTPWLQIGREVIGPKPAWIDANQFRQLSRCHQTPPELEASCLASLVEAVALYQADFMAGFTLRDSPEFDAWQRFQAEDLRRGLAEMLVRLIHYYQRQDAPATAIDYCRRWLESDPVNEAAHRELMQLYRQSGQRSEALRQYHSCAQILQQRLGAAPARETTALYEQIAQELPEASPKITPALNLQDQAKPEQLSRPDQPDPANRLHNFPALPSSFIGRQIELAEITARLANPACRLLTLTGPGGIGKTRLAIQAAAAQQPAFAGGIYFVPLAPVSSPDFLIPTLAESLKLTLDGGAALLPQLLNLLRQKQILLVVDNFEHLVRKANLLNTLLEQCPEIKILVTSQERLNLQGEWLFEVKGMDYPGNPAVNQLERYGAVALFLQRAYQVSSTFFLAEAERPALVRICQLMDGNPLGIELAASWVRLLSCREICQEIEQIYASQARLDFLTTPLRDIPTRHQNLRGVFEYSWQLLSNEEKSLFRHLAVFRGGAQREAIEWVTGTSLELIVALVDKSLLARSRSGRYELHELLRQFAAEKLAELAEEANLVQQRHCLYYAALLQQRSARLKGAGQQETLAEIAREMENIRAAWRWAISQDRIDIFGPGLESLWYFYSMYSGFQEGIETFGRALACLRTPGSEERERESLTLQARILTYLGWFYLRQGLYAQAQDLLKQSISLLNRLHDREHLAAPLHHLGILAGEVGEAAEAVRLLQEGLAIFRQVDNRWGTAWSLSSLAYHLSELDPRQTGTARALLQESLALYQAIGNKQGIAIALNNLGHIAYQEGDYPAARRLLQESLALRREVGFPRGIAVALNQLGHISSALGDFDICKRYYYEALRIARDIQTLPLTLEALGGLAMPLIQEGKTGRATELLALVLAHPSSTKESRDRATALLAQLETPLEAGPGWPQPQVSLKKLEGLVEAMLEEAIQQV